MVENTDRFGLNTYSQGDTNWDHTDTVQTIDELAIERGAAADRPDSGDYDDELYLATDQQILYRWDTDATDWIVEGVGSEADPLPKVWANEIDVNTLETESVSTGSVSAGSVSAEELNNAVHAKTDGISVDDAITQAGEGGAVIVHEGTFSEGELGEDWDFEDNQTVVGLGDVIIETGDSESPDNENRTGADGLRLVNLHFRAEVDGVNEGVVRFVGSDIKIIGCTLENTSDTDGSAGVIINGSEILISNVSARGERSIRVGGSASGCSIVGGLAENEISISGSASNIEQAGVVIT